jgi:glycosyltransferase involved in cell wall biosynthesis
MAPLTVALPISTFLPNRGGAEVGLHNIAVRLQQRGHRPVVIAPEVYCHRLRQEGWHLPYEVVGFPPRVWGVLRRWPQLGLWWLDRVFARLGRRWRIDFWHVTMGYPVGVAMVHYAERQSARIPYLIRCAGEDIQTDPEIGYGARLDPAIDRLVRTWLPRARRLTAITDSVADEYRALGVDTARITMIPNGVDLARFDVGRSDDQRMACRRRLGLPEDAVVFLAVGRHHPKKNFALLVQAAGQLRQRCPDRAFVVALVGGGVSALRDDWVGVYPDGPLFLHDTASGTDPERHDGTALLQLPDAQVVDFYLSADVFVFPSRIETFGIVLAEAMAAGLPIVTGDAPGCRDLIRYGQDGIMVPALDVAGYVAAMERLLLSVEERQMWSARARLRSTDFSWDRVVDQYVALYRQEMDR